MPAPLPVPHIPPGFPPLATAGGQTTRPGGPTTLETEAGGHTSSPGSPTAPLSCSSNRHSGLGGPTTTAPPAAP
jgi:hypothetical protein